MEKLLAEWRSQLKRVTIPRPFAVDPFLANLADARDREIVILVRDLGAQVFGLWVPYPDEDVLFIDENIPAAQHDPIILHETGHMICGHPHDPDRTAQLRQRLAPHINLQRWDELSARTSYQLAAESQAERFGRAMSTLARRDRRVAAVDDEDARARVGVIMDIFG